MLYQAVRPRIFEEFIGNEATVKAVKSIVEAPAELRPHAILFAGDSGCGKTTLARIFARAVGCNSRSDNGEGPDMVELNAANVRGIDTVREIVNSAAFSPLMGDAKVYILDESHQLTSAAQEAILKVIEDTPLHCYFVFCTTEPESLIKTIRNRCSRFDLIKLRYPDMMKLLAQSSEIAGTLVSDKILSAIANQADGCPREALVLLEKIIGVTDEEKALECISVSQIIEKTTFDLCKLIIDPRIESWKRALEVLATLDDNPEAIRQSLLGYLRQCLLKSKNIEDAARFAKKIGVLSENSFASGKAQLAAQVFRVCLEV